jgi:uncharacterized protein (TIGR04222 family)
MRHAFARAACCLISLAALNLSAEERILSYHSDIEVLADGQLDVTETIRVLAEGNNIRRGIYRDFPTRYEDRAGNRYRVVFDVESVERNGRPEDWHTDGMSNGVRVYAGNANRFLDPGEHEYRFRYRTNRQIGFFEDYDELWWNVTGNGWRFPIDQASATIRLPSEVAQANLTLNAYTGVYGSTATHARSRVLDGRAVEFETTRALGPWENLSVIVAFPKGLVEEPSAPRKVRWFLSDNGAALVLGLGWLGMLAWYLWTWNRVGRDPATGVIIPRFEPPAGLSPAACRYVLSMGMRAAAFVAAIVSLAVKGHLVIDEQGRDFTLERIDNPKAEHPTAGERAALIALFPTGAGILEMERDNHARFRRAREHLEENLQREYKGRLFKLNSLYILPAFAIFLLSVLLATQFHVGPWVWVIFIFSSIVMHLLFWFLLRAPTPAGRRIMDEIEGFKRYLGTAEQDRLEMMRSPSLTPEVFEAFLPYAYALGVENSWCERFAHEVPEEIRKDAGWQPGWYSGRSFGVDSIRHMGSGFSSGLSSAISSASTPPGSSSGSGGGGFSGGGGGGGGGGGW